MASAILCPNLVSKPQMKLSEATGEPAGLQHLPTFRVNGDSASVGQQDDQSNTHFNGRLWAGSNHLLSNADQIALPDFNAGAMENWGLITYRETALLYDANFSSNSNKERIATIIAHELAHMVRAWA